MTATEYRPITAARPPLGELAARNVGFEGTDAADIVAWAWDRFGEGCTLTASFEDAVMVDLVSQVAPKMDVVLIDTGYLFTETLDFAEQMRQRFDLNLRVASAGPVTEDLWRTDVDACCRARKIEPLLEALRGQECWLSGLRRADSTARATAPIVSWDLGKAIVKVNPIATWSDEAVDAYVAERDLPHNPMLDRGYGSVGCWPCTTQVAPGADPRSGRWAGLDKTECGLHL